MKKGNIAGSAAPRLIFVWDGLLARVTDERRYERALKRMRWTDVVNAYTTDAVAAARVWDLSWRHSFALDLVTFEDADILPALQQRIDRERLPFGWVTAETPDSLAHRGVYEPNLARIYDPDPHRALRYGSKGRHVSDIRVMNLLD